MKTSLGLVIAGAIVTTMTAGIAAVWLSGDPRAFGVIVTIAGVVAGVLAIRQESTSAPGARHTAPVQRPSGTNNLPKAA